MLPAYLALVVRGSGDPGSAAVGRAVAATAAMTLGFLAVFGVFGLLTVSLASTVQQYLPYVTVVDRRRACGARHLAAQRPRADRAVPDRMAGGASAGADRAARFDVRLRRGLRGRLAVLHRRPVSRGHRRRPRRTVRRRPGVGLSGLRGGIRVGGRHAGRRRPRSPALRWPTGSGESCRMSTASAVPLLILVGALRRATTATTKSGCSRGGDPADPVIAAAGRLQGAIAGWVHRHGAWPWLVLLAATAVAAWLLRRAYVRRGQLKQ